MYGTDTAALPDTSSGLSENWTLCSQQHYRCTNAYRPGKSTVQPPHCRQQLPVRRIRGEDAGELEKKQPSRGSTEGEPEAGEIVSW